MNNSNLAGWKRTFFIIWSGQAFSLFGSELVQFALVWFLTRQTGSASVLAMASFVALLPRVLISPFIGALIDRWNRQRVMIFADLFIAGFTLVLAVIFWQNRVQVWHIYAIMFIRALGSSFHWPAMQSSTSLMVPKDQLARISGMNQTLQGILGILAPMTAALLLDILPMQGMLAIDILTALIAITPLLFVVIPQPVKNEGVTPYAGIGGLIRDVKEGFRYLANWKGMMVLTIAATLLNFLLNPGFTFTPLLVTQHFGKGAVELSLVEAVFSFGMIAGGIMLSVWGGFKRRIMTTLSGIMGIAVSTAIIAVAKPSEFLWAAAGMGVTGFMMPITNGPISAIMQAHVEPEIQGRVFTMTNSLMSAMIPVSMLVAAPVAEWIGIRGWLALASAGCLVIGITCFCVPELMDVENPLSKKRN
ncbi:MAG: MFS transporter [Anaerolineae bacterium]|nr:MFS transporter [Anaerolineae bacterium]